MSKSTLPERQVKVVLLENIHPRAVDAFREAGFHVDHYKTALAGDELLEATEGAQLLGIRSKTQLDQSFFEAQRAAGSRLWSVGCFCIGTNQVDLSAAADAGVTVYNAPFSNTRSVAELTIAEIVALQRKIFQRSSELHNGDWQKSAAGSHEVRGKTLGVVGYGRIGSQVSVLAENMGMNVIFYDPLKQLALGNAVQKDSLEEVLKTSDIVTLHVPALPTTKNMMNHSRLSMMKHGAKLINNARGSVVDLEALREAMLSGQLGGAAIDVFPTEPGANGPGFESCMQNLPNAILTPHVAGSTLEAQENIADEVSSKLLKMINEGSTTTAVNLPEVELPRLPMTDQCRVLHMHDNVPGMLGKINQVTAEYDINVYAQYLKSNNQYSYMVMDIEPKFAEDVVSDLKKFDETVFARLIL